MAITMTKRYIERADFLDFNLKYMKLVGLWPDENWSKFGQIVYKIFEIAIHIASVVYLIITGIGTYDHKDEDVSLFLSNLDKTLVAYNFFLKVVVFMFKRERLNILITEIMYSGDKISEDRKKLMATHVVFVTIMCLSIVGAFSAMAQYKYEMTVEAWMPFDPLKNRMNLLLAAQILALTLLPGLGRALALQGIVCSLIMYLCDQLIDLQKRLRALNYISGNENLMRQEFKKIVKKHARLMRYSQTMNGIFKEFFMIQNLAVTVELCLNAMMVTVVGMEEKKLLASFLAFLCIALLNAYIFCYLGDELIVQSGNIAIAAYESTWTSWPVALQKDLLIVIRVAQRPFRLTAGGMVNMCINTFSQALYNGYSIFAVLNDVVD